MKEHELLELLDLPFSFRSQPTPTQPQLRVIWGLSILALILKICSRGDRSSIPRMHVLNWATKNSENRENLINILENHSSPLKIISQI
jgi:hypothetical protein